MALGGILVPCRVLIVAYGNPLRCDDGIAWRAANALEGKFPQSEVEILQQHELTPELAETASLFERVIFMDAATVPSSLPGEIRVEELRSEATDAGEHTRFLHALSPQTIVGLAQTLYGVKLEAILVTVTAQNFDHGDALSPAAAAALPVLVERVESMVGAFLCDGVPS